MMSTASAPKSPQTTSPMLSPTGSGPSIADVNGKLPPRRTSLGFLRRSKSGEPPARLSKKERLAHQQELQRQAALAAAVPKAPPRLPDLYNGAPPAPIRTFGGEAVVESPPSNRKASNGPTAVAPIPFKPSVDPYARTESMTNRGRYSYASSAYSTINSPRRVRRRKDPTPFNILVIGAKNSGKTSFLEFLRTALAPRRRVAVRPDQSEAANAETPSESADNYASSAFTSHYLETEIDSERVGLTLWDSQGLEKNLVDLQLKEMISFIESKFEETFTEEMKVIRSPGVQDTHIHCIFLVLDPSRLEQNMTAAKRSPYQNGHTEKTFPLGPKVVGGLDEDLDLQVIRALQGKSSVIPVISKADTITAAHMKQLKRMVAESLKLAKLDPMEALGLNEQEELPNREAFLDEKDEEDLDSDSSGTSLSEEGATKEIGTSSDDELKEMPAAKEEPESLFPLSIISPDLYDPGVIGRKFPWGFADPYNAEHCDFVRLKDAVFNEWRGELREASREVWYEGWRTSRLRRLE